MRIFAAIGITLMLAGCAGGGGRLDNRERYNRAAGKPVANPSAVVKAELSFARLAQEKGQWTAFRETAADEAIMFTPDIVNAQQWLKGKSDPAQPVEWQPHNISMSCDGSLAVSKGAWQSADGRNGSFVTIWRLENFEDRHRGKEEKWKWVFDHATPLDQPLAQPDFIETAVATCGGERPGKASGPVIDKAVGKRGGKSRDGTLIWDVVQNSGGKPSIIMSIWDGKEMQHIGHALREDQKP